MNKTTILNNGCSLMNLRASLSLTIFILFTALVAVAQAGEFVPRFGFQIESRSNVTRGNDSGLIRPVTADTVIEPYVGFLFTESIDKIKSEISLQLDHQEYVDGTFSAQNFLSIDGFIDYEIIPGRFIWATEDAANTRRIVLEDPGTPDNLQTFNVFTTGPDLFFTRGANEVVLKGRLGTANYSDQLADNIRLLGSAALTRAVSPVMDISLNSTASFVRFDEEFQTDYDLYAFVARLDRDTPWGSLSLTGGYNVLDFESGFKENQPLIEGALVIGKEDGANSLTLSAASKFSDPALDVSDPDFTRLFQAGGLGTVDSNERAGTGATDTKRVEFNFDHRGDIYGFGLFGFSQDIDRPVSTQNSQEEIGLGMNFNFAFTPNLTAWATYFQLETDFKNSDTHIEAMTPALGLNWELQRNWFVSVGAKFEEETSNTAERNFEDEIVFVSLQYQAESIESETE